MYQFFIPILFLLPIITFGQNIQEAPTQNNLSRESRLILEDITDCSAVYTICNEKGYVVDYDKDNIPEHKQDDLPAGGVTYEYFENTESPKSLSIKRISILGIGLVGAKLNFREDFNIENAELKLFGITIKKQSPTYTFWDNGSIKTVKGSIDFEGRFETVEEYNNNGLLLKQISVSKDETQTVQYYPNGLVRLFESTSANFGDKKIEYFYNQAGDISKIIEYGDVTDPEGVVSKGTITTEFRDFEEYVTTTYGDGTTKTDKVTRTILESGEVEVQVIEGVRE